MIDITKFIIGVIYLFITIGMIYLMYISFTDNDIHLGLITLFCTFMIGGMSFIAFKEAFEDAIKNKEMK